MALDPSIILGVKPIQLDNQLQQYGNIMGIQNAQNQNALAQYQLSRARRDDEDQNLLRRELIGVDLSTPEGLSKARSAYLKIGKVKEAQDLGKSALETRELTGKITAQDIKAARDRLEAFSGLVAPLVQRENVTHDDVFSVGNRAQQMGLLQNGWQQSVPQSATQLPDWIRSIALSTDQGRKSLDAVLPKPQAFGGAVVNTNPLAPNFMGKLADVAPTAGDLMTNQRGITSQTETERANRERERLAREAADRADWTYDGERGIMVNKRTGATRGVTAADGQPLANSKPLTEAQGNATGFGMRARTSADIIGELEEAGTFGRVANIGESIRTGIDRLPIVGGIASPAVGAAGNIVNSAPQQKYAQAKGDFIRAVLRKESGATISPSESSDADRQYFPQFGDSDAVIAQKRQNRETAINALATQAGHGASRIPKAKAPAKPAGAVKNPADMTDAELQKALGLNG